MIFKQLDDGSCEICFSDQEVQILKRNKKIVLTAEGLRHFSNNLIRIVADFNEKFPDSIKSMQTDDSSTIEGK
jgi:hypothetical protein